MSDYDSFLDSELEKYYEELEEDILDWVSSFCYP